MFLNTMIRYASIMVFLGLMACESSHYSGLVKTEYNSGEVNDSLFLGFSFGMTQKEFFNAGWEMNKKGLIMQGPQNQNVSYTLKSADGSRDIEMLFYPEFDVHGRVKNMPARFMYKGWAPWNLNLFSDSLLLVVKDTLMDWYGGNNFYLFEKPDENIRFWYKVDGNRQITLATINEREVKAVIKNLLHPDNDPFK